MLDAILKLSVQPTQRGVTMQYGKSVAFTVAFAVYEPEEGSVEAAAMELIGLSGCEASVVEAEDDGAYEDDCFADLA